MKPSRGLKARTPGRHRAVSLLLVLLASTAGYGQGTGLDPAVPGQVVLRLLPGRSITAFHATFGSSAADFSIPSRSIHVVTPPPGESPASFAGRLDGRDGETWVAWAELEYVGDAPEGSARDFFFFEGPDSAPYGEQPAWDQIELSGAHELTGGAGITVAVLDTGLDPLHPALLGRIAPGGAGFARDSDTTLDFTPLIPLDSNGNGTPDEMVGHGTHVAALVARVAPQAWILPVRVLDSDGNTTNTRLAAGIFHAVDQGVDVISISAGSTYDSKSFEDALAEARLRGIPVIAAAGNLNRATPEEYPAMHELAIAVGAVGPDDVRSTFSNYHERLALVAPGEEIYSALPEQRYAAWNGTSFATPMVAGAAALLIAHHPEWPANEARADQVRAFLQAGATPIDALNPGYEGLLGAGRLNVAAALQLELLFVAQPELNVQPQPGALVVADFNNDGRLDLAVASGTTAVVEVLLADAAGQYGPAILLPIVAPASALAAADFNGDGHIDLATMDDNSERVSILLNLGDAHFAPATSFPACDGNSLVAADFTGDGRIDLMTVCEDLAATRLYRNDGGGVFSLAGQFPVTGQRPEQQSVGDVDGDGRPDVIVSTRTGSQITLLRNLGDGQFASEWLPTGQEPRAVLLADINGDGFLDALTGNHRGPGLSILLNDGHGNFTLAASLTLPGDRMPEAMAVADMDCDGHPDLVFTDEDGLPLVSILLNRGDLSFTGPLSYSTGPGPVAVRLADLDGDGDRDVVLANSLGATLSWLRNATCPRSPLGDANCDGLVSFDDIEAFVAAVLGPLTHRAAYPDCSWLLSDMNRDGVVNFADVDGFVQRMIGGL